jgi:hypothetical protein
MDEFEVELRMTQLERAYAIATDAVHRARMRLARSPTALHMRRSSARPKTSAGPPIAPLPDCRE